MHWRHKSTAGRRLEQHQAAQLIILVDGFGRRPFVALLEVQETDSLAC
jgi:hypothetical protein